MRAPLKTAAATWAPSLNIIIIIIIMEYSMSVTHQWRKKRNLRLNTAFA